MLMLWRRFPPSCTQSWKIKKHNKFVEDVCANSLEVIHTHYIATTLLKTGPEDFFFPISINLGENRLPFYCLLIQTLALTDQAKFLFCLLILVVDWGSRGMFRTNVLWKEVNESTAQRLVFSKRKKGKKGKQDKKSPAQAN